MTSSRGDVLVADDDPEALKLLTVILTEEGYHVRPADSGKLALASTAAEHPELILLDVRMPDIDGFEVCRRLKERAETRDIPVMFISGSSDMESQVEGLGMGAVDFVLKPIRRADLLARVGTHLELGRLQTRLEKLVIQRSRNCKALSTRFCTRWRRANGANWRCTKSKGGSGKWQIRRPS